jgi:hypothetical protein
MAMKRGSTILFTLTVVLVAVVAMFFVRGNQLQAAFESIEIGATASSVTASMGKPEEIRPCSENLYWGGDDKPLGRNDGTCVVEYYYGYIPGGWSVGLDASERVVSKYVYVSQ